MKISLAIDIQTASYINTAQGNSEYKANDLVEFDIEEDVVLNKPGTQLWIPFDLIEYVLWRHDIYVVYGLYNPEQKTFAPNLKQVFSIYSETRNIEGGRQNLVPVAYSDFNPELRLTQQPYGDVRKYVAKRMLLKVVP